MPQHGGKRRYYATDCVTDFLRGDVKMKKILAFMLALVMAVSALVYGEGSDAAEAEAVKEYEILTALGVIEPVTDFGATVSRREAVKRLLRVCQSFSGAGTSVKDFYDVTKKDADYNDIMLAVQLGMVSGFSDNTFRPDNEISGRDFIVMAVSLLGYRQRAESIGGYPVGYYTVASELDIPVSFKNIDENLSYNEMIEILYNVVNAPLVVQTVYGSTNEYTKDKDATILSEYYDIYKKNGIIKTNDVTSLSLEVPQKGKVMISGEWYDTEANLNKLLGCNVKFWYKVDKKEGTQTVLYAETNSNTRSTEIDANDICSYSDYRLGYIVNDKTKTVNLEKTFKIVYNGKLLLDYVTDYENSECIFKQDCGSFRLVDNDGNGSFDVVFADVYIDVVLNQISVVDDAKIYITAEHKVKTMEFDITDEEFAIEATDKDGNTLVGAELSGLSQGSVLSIYADKLENVNGKTVVSSNAEYVRIVESGESVSGKYASNKSKNGREYFSIDGTAYPLSATNYLYEDKAPEIGGTYVFLLNSRGEIVDFSRENSVEKAFVYGYLITAASTSGMENNLNVKLLTEEGEVKILSAAKRIDSNGTRTDDREKVLNGLKQSAKLIISDKNDMSQLVKYKLNANGELSALETVIDNSHHDDHLSLDFKKLYLTARTKGNVLLSGSWDSVTLEDGSQSGTSRGFYFTPSKAFFVPAEVKSDDFYRIGKFSDEGKYTVEAWDVGDDLMPGAVVVYSGDNTEKIGTKYVVEDIITKLDDDGGVQKAVCVHDGITERELIVEQADNSAESVENYNEVMNLRKGDVVMFGGDSERMIVRSVYKKYFSFADRPEISSKTEKNGATDRNQFTELYYADGRYLVTQRGAVTSGSSREEKFPWFWNGSTSLMKGAVLYDATNPERIIIRQATLNDLKPAYFYGNEESSKLFTCESYGEPNFVVIYNGI